MPHSVQPLPRADLSHVLVHTRELWAEARGSRFFITGGTGFFGMWLLESFVLINETLGLGMHATVLTRDPGSFARKAPHLANRPELTLLQGDVRSFQPPEASFDYVVHAATDAGGTLNADAPHEMLDSIVVGTRRVLELAARGPVRKLLLTSSGAVYGKQPSGLSHVSEDYLGAPDPLQPASAYGEGKRLAEHMCAVHAVRHGYAVKIARCFAFVGPHLPLDGHFAAGNFLRDALAGEMIRIAGDGTPVRSYLYAADLTVWLWTLLFAAPSARAYNVGSADAIDLRALAEQVASCTRPACGVHVARPPDPSQAPARYVPSIARAETELGLRVRIPLPEALARTCAWLRQNPSLFRDL